MSNQLAVSGGTPVRNTEIDPWSPWPLHTTDEWESKIEPLLREVYLSGNEGSGGTMIVRFREQYAQYTGTNYALFMPHGTDAISAALAGALDLDGFSDGGEVIVPNYTFVATASAVLERRCTVVFVDISPETFTIDPEAVAAAITSETRAILPVHLGGHPADMGALQDIARRHELAIVEDCAQAHSAEYQTKKVGALSDVGAFSFQASKNLTSGEGGMVTTNDKDIHDRVSAFMNVGRAPGGARWEYPRLGWNYRPSEYLAAILLVRLELLEAQTDIRNRNATYLSNALETIEGITPPELAPWVTKHGYHLYCLKYNPEGFGGKSRQAFVNALSAEGVPCSIGYRSPLSEEPGMAHVAQKYPRLIRSLPCPNAASVCEQSVWLFQNLLLGSEADMDQIVEAITKIHRAWN
ncbi:MAG: DegT/DnrJ/EryC1/StrS family aminotransferase [Candidatus Poribacteria bacterium]|nr:DegT/DnrJ/EryC1/StrS family aminotransferase [Candidatus Poribacteria bacterium]